MRGQRVNQLRRRRSAPGVAGLLAPALLQFFDALPESGRLDRSPVQGVGEEPVPVALVAVAVIGQTLDVGVGVVGKDEADRRQ
jgi:hypothetical protein